MELCKDAQLSITRLVATVHLCERPDGGDILTRLGSRTAERLCEEPAGSVVENAAFPSEPFCGA